MKKLSPAQHTVLEPACLLAKKSPEVVIGVPGIGAAEIFYPITGTDEVRVKPHKLARHLARLDITLHSLCILVAQTAEDDLACVLRFKITEGGLTTLSCHHCKLHVNWTPQRTRDFSDPQWAALDFARPSIDKAIERLVQCMRDDQGEHYLTLLPTLSTSSVEAYRMSSDRIPWNSAMPANRNGPTLSPGPSTPATHSEGAHESQLTSRYEHIIQEADNEFVGIMEWECSGLFEKCDRESGSEREVRLTRISMKSSQMPGTTLTKPGQGDWLGGGWPTTISTKSSQMPGTTLTKPGQGDWLGEGGPTTISMKSSQMPGTTLTKPGQGDWLGEGGLTTISTKEVQHNSYKPWLGVWLLRNTVGVTGLVQSSRLQFL
ncbi:hypothetical protein JB92DRAFT_2835233 [Gautieria morchelliformis]|nr:hypothetical protein JB92DRAFT_2835233 [Gautieria morchelliformis]